MNLPNKLTIFRILLVPVILVIAEIPQLDFILFYHVTCKNLIILIIFLIGTFTDFLDGHIARKYNLITDLGKFLDPIADKILVMAILIIMLEQKTLLKGYVVTLIIFREFAVTGMRLIAAEKKRVIAAGWLGKIKTNLQFALAILLLINGPFNGTYTAFEIIIIAFMYLTLLLTIVSGAEYIIKNIDIFKTRKEEE